MYTGLFLLASDLPWSNGVMYAHTYVVYRRMILDSTGVKRIRNIENALELPIRLATNPRCDNGGSCGSECYGTFNGQHKCRWCKRTYTCAHCAVAVEALTGGGKSSGTAPQQYKQASMDMYEENEVVGDDSSTAEAGHEVADVVIAGETEPIEEDENESVRLRGYVKALIIHPESAVNVRENMWNNELIPSRLRRKVEEMVAGVGSDTTSNDDYQDAEDWQDAQNEAPTEAECDEQELKPTNEPESSNQAPAKKEEHLNAQKATINLDLVEQQLGWVGRDQGKKLDWADEVEEEEGQSDEEEESVRGDDEPQSEADSVSEVQQPTKIKTKPTTCKMGAIIDGEPMPACQGEGTLIGTVVPKGFKCQRVLIPPPESKTTLSEPHYVLAKLKCGSTHKVQSSKSTWLSEVGRSRLASSMWLAKGVDPVPLVKPTGPRVDYNEYKMRFNVDPRVTGVATDVTSGCECAGCLTYAAAPVKYRKYNSSDIPVWHIEASTLWAIKVPEDKEDRANQWGPHGYYRVSKYHKGNIIAGIATMANMIGRVLSPMKEEKLDCQPCPPINSGPVPYKGDKIVLGKWKRTVSELASVKHGGTPNILHLAICDHHTYNENHPLLEALKPNRNKNLNACPNAEISLGARLSGKQWDEETIRLLNYLLQDAQGQALEVDGSRVGLYEHYLVAKNAEYVHYKPIADCQVALENKLRAPGIKADNKLKARLSRNTRGTANEILL
jgi:hypothetical protein